MAHEIRHTFICDVCGFEYPGELRKECGLSYTQILNDPRSVQSRETIPQAWNFIAGRLVCYKHRIIVEVDRGKDCVVLQEPQT